MPVADSRNRLAQIDKRDTTTLTVDGKKIPAVIGESIAAALTAAGVLALRKDRTGRPRGVLCGMGSCFECQVSVNGNPPQRACLTPVADLMTVTTLAEQHDYLEPAEATVRQKNSTCCDVLMIGAGPAGASAAVKLAAAGRQVVVVDERHAAGGQFYKQKISALRGAGDDRQYRDGKKLLERLQASSAEVLLGATVWGAFNPNDSDGERLEIVATTADSSLRFLPKTLIVATGAYESIPPFPGWTLPGVMTTGAAQTLLRAYRVVPGQRVLIAGNGPLNLQLACELVRLGVQVVAIAESAPATLPRRTLAALRMAMASPSLTLTGLRYLWELKKRGVPVHYGHRIDQAMGAGCVAEASISQLTNEGTPLPQTAKTFAVDAVCLGYRQQPSAELLKALGCQTTRLPSGVEAIVRNPVGETNIPGVYAIGDGATPLGAHSALCEGRLVADAILGDRPNSQDRRQQRRQHRFQQALWQLFAAPSTATIPDNVTVCRCECISADTLRGLIAKGVHDLGELKRESRAGMGPCQGRYCEHSLQSLLAERTPPAATTETRPSFAIRNPVKPVSPADIVEERPEWRGYQAATIPPRRSTTPRTDTLIDECDVLIVGAGIIGVATALWLARRGVDVLLVDAGTANCEASGGNAGSLHLQLLPFDFQQDVRTSPAATTLPLQKMGIRLWQQLERELDADFELSIGGGLMLADGENDLEFLRQKALLEAEFGVTTELLSATETRHHLPDAARHVAGSAFCAGEGKINPLLATPQILTAARKAGARLREAAAVIAIDARDAGYRAQTSLGAIDCQTLVNAAGGWAADITAMLGQELPILSAPQQMLVTQAIDSRLPFLLSLAQRHLTLKQAANGNLIIGGGWPASYDPLSGQSVTRADSIAGNLWAAQRVFPVVNQLQLLRSWGAVGVMIDGAPIVGELPGQPGFYTVVAANGYTMAPALGLLTSELITTGQASVNLTPFGCQRFGSPPEPSGNP